MSVFLTNLDDYIAPSQACVNPFVASRKTSNDGNDKNPSAKISIQLDLSISEFETVKPNLIKSKLSSIHSESTQKVATVSLNDCLACSGCITSAESVLIQEQSYSKLLSKLLLNDSLVVVAVSPQSLASLAAMTGMTSMELFLRISSFFKDLGVYYVLDMAAVGDIALLEAREEFIKRYRGGHDNTWITPQTTMAVSSNSMNIITGSGNDIFNYAPNTGDPNLVEVKDLSIDMSIELHLPMLASSCPGWICYAEKSQPQAIPYISSTKSPQQILGTIVKSIIFPTSKDMSTSSSIHSREYKSNDIYIVSIQPCFDKKLEASRKDFYHEDSDFNEIDLVLSTTELWNLLEFKAESLELSTMDFLVSIPLDAQVGRDDIEALFRSYSSEGSKFMSSINESGGSGGLVEHIVRYAAEELLGIDMWSTVLDYKVGRNIDIAEVEIISQDGQETSQGRRLKFARAYGFRNIQSLMLKMKRGKCEYDFVEVMACPSGCINGGGQVKVIGATSTRESPEDSKGRISSVSEVFHDTEYHRPEDSKLARYLYSSGVLGCPMSAQAVELFHTRYHAVPKLELMAPIATKW